MKKETGIAVGLGVFFGLVFSFVIILNTQTNKSVSQKKQMDKSRPALDARQGRAVVKPVELLAPGDRTITETAAVTVKLKVEKNNFVVIQTPSQDIATESQTEEFSKSVPLTLGENVIRISVYTKGGGSEVQEKEIRVYYLPEA